MGGRKEKAAGEGGFGAIVRSCDVRIAGLIERPDERR
jgi:hypothetical protein